MDFDRLRRFHSTAIKSLTLTVFLFGAMEASAQLVWGDAVRTWVRLTSSTGGNDRYGRNGNWSGGNEPNNATTQALFTGANLENPEMNQNRTAGQFRFTSTASATTFLEHANDALLTLNASNGEGVVHEGEVTHTFDARFAIANSQSWLLTAANGQLVVNDSFNLNSHTLTIDTQLASNTVDFSSGKGVVSGTGGFTKIGDGTMILSGANTFTGAVTITNGVVSVRNNTGLGTTAGGVTVALGAALELQGGITIGTEALTLNGTGISSNGALRNVSGTNSYAGAITLGSATEIQSDADTLTLSGGISGAGQNLTIDGSGNTTVSGAITTTTGTLTKTGSGSLILSGTNTYSGGTTVSAGTLQIGDSGTTGAVVGNITNNAALIFDRSNTISYSDIISGTGSLTKNGAGNLTLTGANTYSGGTTVSTGTLQIGDSGTTGSVAGNITNNAALIFDRSNAISYSDIISGTGSLTKNGAGNLTLTGANTYSGGTTVSAGTLQIGDSGTTGAVLGNITNNAALIFDRSDAISYSDIISGTGSLTKNGAGNLTLSAINTYSGGTTVNAGTLTLSTGGSTGAIRGDLTINSGATLDSTVGNTIGYGADRVQNITVDGGTINHTGAGDFGWTLDWTVSDGALLSSNGGVFSNLDSGSGSMFSLNKGSTITATSGTSTIEGRIDLRTDDTGTEAQISVSSGATLNITAGVVDSRSGTSGAGGFEKLGDGTLTLSGANVYEGTTTITAGTLVAQNDTALGSSIGGTTVATGATLQLENGISIASEALTVTGTGRLLNASDDNTYSGIISGTGQLEVDAGSLTLDAANDYSGVSTINSGGTLVAAHNTALGTTAGSTSVNSGGTLSLTNGIAIGAEAITNNGTVTNTSGTNSYAGIMSGTGNLTTVGGNLTLSGTNTYSGISTIGSGTTLTLANSAALGATAGGTMVDSGGTLSFTNGITVGTEAIVNNGTIDNTSGTNSYAGDASGTGNLTVTAGQLTVTGANTYTGGTTISGGTLQLGAGGTTGSVTGNITNNSSLIFNRSDSSTYANVLSGTGTVEQAGTGNLTFSGTNTYTGATTVSDGTLTLANSSALGTAAAGTTVDSGAILALTNGINVASEAVTNNGTLTNTSGTNTFGGVISGTGAVTTTTGNLTLSNTNTYSGNTTINSGSTLTASANNALGSGSTTVNSGGTLALTSGITVAQTSYDLSGTGNSSAGAIQNISGSNRITGDLTLSANTTLQSDAGTLNVGSDFDGSVYEASGNQLTMGANNLTIDGAGNTVLRADLTGTGNLIKDGNGQFTMANGTNAWTGTTQINDGEMVLATYFNDAPGVGPLADFGIRGPVIIGDGTEGAGTATLTLGTADAGSGNFSNMFAGGVDVTVNSDGHLDTRGQTTYVQNIALDGGSINAQTGAAGGNNLLVTGDITSTHTSQTATIDGYIDFNSDSDQSINVSASSTLDINARVQNGGIDKSGTGTLVLSGGNTFTDDVDVLAGVVRVDNNLGLGSVTGGTNVTSGAQLQLDGVTIGAEALTLNGTGISSDGALQTVASSGANSWAGNVTVASTSEIEVSSGSSLAITGNVTGSGKTLTIESIGNTTLSGTNTLNTLNKTGAGNLTVLTSPNTISTVNVDAGTFTVGTSNILNDSLDLNVNASGTLAMAGGINETIDQLNSSGTLDIDGILTMNGGTISGGSGAGSSGEMILTANNTLTITSDYDFGGTLELTSDTVLALAGDGNQIDIGHLKVTGDTVIDFGAGENIELNLGSLTIATGTTITVNNWNSFQDLWTTGSFTGGTGSVTIDERDTNTAQITFNGFSSSDTIWLTLDFGSNEITVPEPSSYGALLIGFGLAGWIVRRPKRSSRA